MTTQDFVNQIMDSIHNNETARVYFKGNRAPVYGKFVIAPDHSQQIARGFIRFVPGNWIDEWELTGDLQLTRLYLITSISLIKIFQS